MYRQFIDWLDTTQLSLLFKETSWIVPAVQSVHILGIAVVLAGAVMLSLRLARLRAQHLEIPALTGRLVPVLWWATLVLLLTGIVLIIAEPTRTLNNPYFFAKLGCLLLLIPLTRWFQLAVRRQPARWSGAAAPSSAAARPAVAVALLLLITIIFCGRWIAYA